LSPVLSLPVRENQAIILLTLVKHDGKGRDGRADLTFQFHELLLCDLLFIGSAFPDPVLVEFLFHSGNCSHPS